MPPSPKHSLATVSEGEIREQLQRVLASPGFSRAPRMRRFLTFVVEGVIAGHGKAENLKECVIGVAVFDRDADYDPKADPVVRVEARRLRAKLEEYYTGLGKDDAIRLEIPKGSYVPLWSRQGEPQADHIKPRPSRSNWKVLVSAIVAGLIALGLFIAASKWRFFPAGPAKPIASLAVLPFRNLTNDAANNYLIDGLTDEITTELAKAGSLKVISRTSSDLYRNTSKALPEIARELKVDAIVEGTFRISANRVRVTAQLIRAATDSHLWAETYERDAGDLFGLQTKIAETIARQIGISLKGSPSGQASQPSNFAAYEWYLRGRYFWNRRTLEGLEKSLECYEKAIREDPNYAAAYAALGESYVLLSSYGGPSNPDSITRAWSAAETALRLNKDSAEAYVVLAVVNTDDRWDWAGATRDFQRAIQLNPGYPTAHHWFALHLSRLARHAQAESEIGKALELDPLSLIIGTDAAQIYYNARRPEQARPYLKRVLELDPNFAEAYLVSGEVYEMEENYPEAIKSFQKANELFGSVPNAWALEGHALALAGRTDEVSAILKRLKEAAGSRYVSGVDIAIVYCGLRDSPDALVWLNKAYASRGKGLNIIGSDPLFDGCRSSEGFQELLAKMHLGPGS
jgi:serine/threonine-protein kinase